MSNEQQFDGPMVSYKGFRSTGVETLTGPGAVNPDIPFTFLVTTGVNAYTLADGRPGARKRIKMKTDGGDGTLTPANFADGSSITFNDANDVCDLEWQEGDWQLISNNGCTINP